METRARILHGVPEPSAAAAAAAKKKAK
jgi:hypothetical protein